MSENNTVKPENSQAAVSPAINTTTISMSSVSSASAVNPVNTEEKIWYYAKPDGSKFGPYTEDELIKLLTNGILTADDFIWMTEFENWMNIGNSIYSYYLGKTL